MTHVYDLKAALADKKTKFDERIHGLSLADKQYHWRLLLAELAADAQRLRLLDDEASYNQALREAKEFERQNRVALRRLA